MGASACARPALSASAIPSFSAKTTTRPRESSPMALAGDLGRPVRRAIVDHQELEVRDGLAQDRVDRPRERPGVVERGDEDSDLRGGHGFQPFRAGRGRRALYGSGDEFRPSSVVRTAGGNRPRLVSGLSRLRAGRATPSQRTSCVRRRPWTSTPSTRSRTSCRTRFRSGSSSESRLADLPGLQAAGPRPGPLALPPSLHAALFPLA